MVGRVRGRGVYSVHHPPAPPCCRVRFRANPLVIPPGQGRFQEFDSHTEFPPPEHMADSGRDSAIYQAFEILVCGLLPE